MLEKPRQQGGQSTIGDSLLIAVSNLRGIAKRNIGRAVGVGALCLTALAGSTQGCGGSDSDLGCTGVCGADSGSETDGSATKTDAGGGGGDGDPPKPDADGGVGADAAVEASGDGGVDAVTEATTEASGETGSTDSGTLDAVPETVGDTGASDTASEATTDAGTADNTASETTTDTATTDTAPADTGAADTAPADTGSTDTGITDTGVADASPADTGAAETALADTALADTALAETALADTALADTGIADTGITDTGAADTGAADTGAVVVVVGGKTLSILCKPVTGFAVDWYKKGYSYQASKGDAALALYYNGNKLETVPVETSAAIAMGAKGENCTVYGDAKGFTVYKVDVESAFVMPDGKNFFMDPQKACIEGGAAKEALVRRYASVAAGKTSLLPGWTTLGVKDAPTTTSMPGDKCRLEVSVLGK